MGRATRPAVRLGAADPLRYFAGLVTLSAIAYVPLALAFTPWAWKSFGPFSLQLCRPLHYAVYFFAGVGIGAYGLERGLLSVDGMLARHWKAWWVAFLARFVMWSLPIGLMMKDDGSSDNGPLGLADHLRFRFRPRLRQTAAFSWPELSLRFARRRWAWLDNLSDNAYGMFLIHYVFVVWLQYRIAGRCAARHRQGGGRVRRNGDCELGYDDRHALLSARRLASRRDRARTQAAVGRRRGADCTDQIIE